MINRKVRRFKVGESLNTIFSARRFGLALAMDIMEALDDFPEKVEVTRPQHDWEYMTDSIDEWLKKWFSDFIEKGEES